MTIEEFIVAGKREDWMCEVDFQYEVGEALGGSTVYPSKEDLRHHRVCVNGEPGDYCKPCRVYVLNADDVDKILSAVAQDGHVVSWIRTADNIDIREFANGVH